MSVRQSCAAAGFEPRTSFARASRLLERDDVRAFVRASFPDVPGGVSPAGRADPAPVCAVGEATDTDAATVSLENVRDVPAAGDGEKHAPDRDGQSPAAHAPKAPSYGVPAPNAAEPEGVGEPPFSLEREERRILSEYEKIAFAEASKDTDLKVADKLRALDQYRAIVERQSARIADAANAERLASGDRLTVVYDYGDGHELG